LDQLSFALKLSWLDLMSTGTRLEMAHAKIHEDEYVNRPCVASLVPFEICDLELFVLWTSKSRLTQDDVNLQLAAGEPTNSTSFEFDQIWELVKTPLSVCLYSYCTY
jgi:hypothetical protein